MRPLLLLVLLLGGCLGVKTNRESRLDVATEQRAEQTGGSATAVEGSRVRTMQRQTTNEMWPVVALVLGICGIQALQVWLSATGHRATRSHLEKQDKVLGRLLGNRAATAGKAPLEELCEALEKNG